MPLRDTVVRQRHTEAPSSVEIDAISTETADHLMKIIVLGGLGDTARLFDYIEEVFTS